MILLSLAVLTITAERLTISLRIRTDEAKNRRLLRLVLAYYFDPQDETNTDIEEAGNVEYWKSLVHAHPARQRRDADQ